jgi:hypothetical protein
MNDRTKHKLAEALVVWTAALFVNERQKDGCARWSF